jgi:hypothetical protein
MKSIRLTSLESAFSSLLESIVSLHKVQNAPDYSRKPELCSILDCLVDTHTRLQYLVKEIREEQIENN